MTTGQKLQRLRAEDVEDLAVMAALLQDSITRIADMAYNSSDRSFMLATKRYRREAHSADGHATQVSAALIFGCIKSVQYRELDVDALSEDLTLLTIATEPGDSTLYRISLVFDGGGEIRLTSDCLHCRMEDFGQIESCDQAPNDHFTIAENGEQVATNS